ncbi:LOW QUALITY PROTEIN: iron-regulated membrane protein [Geomicrobium sp. JCM 19037]|nr:LOW QUALITY PROTEIN: iron-regulated membrane protein [Geomicrobium sp. JCM 19037]
MAKKSKQMNVQVIWRWHLYAGLLLVPFLLVLAITGGIYLFKWDIEAAIYADYYEVEASGETLPPEEQVEIAADEHGGEVVRYRPGEDANRSAEVGIVDEAGESLTVFVNPYTGSILGTLQDRDRVMDRLADLHSELMAGTTGDRIVELVACWTIIMIVSGLYLWFPRKKNKVQGVIVPRFRKGKRTLIRDFHAVPAFWLSGDDFLLVTGLLWTGFWGNGVQQLVTSTGAGYPPSIWVGSAPESEVISEDVADVSWAAENLPVPESQYIAGFEQVSITEVTRVAKQLDIHPTYDVFYPSGQEGVFTLSVFPHRAQDEATVHIDQYNGAVLADYRYDDYGTIGKAMALGITIHKGLQFGFWNQIAGLLVCVGWVVMIISGFWLWKRRKPTTHSGAPRSIRITEARGILTILLIFAVIFPLVGLSLVVVYLIDRYIIRKSKTLRTWLNVQEEEHHA